MRGSWPHHLSVWHPAVSLRYLQQQQFTAGHDPGFREDAKHLGPGKQPVQPVLGPGCLPGPTRIPGQQHDKGCALLTRDDNKRRPEVVAIDLVVSLGRWRTGGPRNALEVEGQSD